MIQYACRHDAGLDRWAPRDPRPECTAETEAVRGAQDGNLVQHCKKRVPRETGMVMYCTRERGHLGVHVSASGGLFTWRHYQTKIWARWTDE